MDYKHLAELLYPDIKTTPEDMYERYPERNLPEGAKVTRFAPSPTGFVHFGSMFPVLTDERLAHQSGGVFMLRIEDTDLKREVKGAEDDIVNTFTKYYGIKFDEGNLSDGVHGDYGPYRQSERTEIYHTFAKKLVEEGKAYPCFCTEEELTNIRNEQKAGKKNIGYYGSCAVWRNRSIEEVEAELVKGNKFVLRFKCDGNCDNKFKYNDLVKGEIVITDNENDHVLLKSNGIPTYHFAHAVDDTLMHTTHVIRGEEWLPSLPYHLQLFRAIGSKPPKYIHLAQLMKLGANGSKKKLSKRDSGASMTYYKKIGYPAESVKEYVLGLLNSNFEEWRTANPAAQVDDFKFSIKKMSVAGCLFDFEKLNDVSKNVISKITAETVYGSVLKWASEYDREFAAELKKDKNYTVSIFNIGRGGNKPRKDITVWGDAKGYMGFFFDKYYDANAAYPESFNGALIADILGEYLKIYSEVDEQSAWFEKIKDVSDKFGFARDMKDYKQSPEKYKGSVADISSFIRVAITGKINSPDMYQVMKIMGGDMIRKRIVKQIERLKNNRGNINE